MSIATCSSHRAEMAAGSQQKFRAAGSTELAVPEGGPFRPSQANNVAVESSSYGGSGLDATLGAKGRLR